MKRIRGRLLFQFLLLTILLIGSRVLDFYSTSLWFFQEGGMAGETNPLTRFFGVGWNGLVLVNIILCGFVIWACFYSIFLYQPPKLQNRPNNVFTYLSNLYFNRDDKFYEMFYKTPKNWRPFLGHFGHSFIRMLILASCLAAGHNFAQYYQWDFYQEFRVVVRRPHYVIFAVILIAYSLIYWRYVNREMLSMIDLDSNSSGQKL